MMKKIFYVAIVVIAVVVVLGVSSPGHPARKPSAAIPMDATDIAGVVTSSNGPESGVWVIAETKDLGTGFRKIVVTDDQGRYLVPDLPKANYTVWVRGYGLVDSPKVQATPGKPLDLKAVILRARRKRRNTIRPPIGTHCCISRRRATSQALDRTGTASQNALGTRASGLN